MLLSKDVLKFQIDCCGTYRYNSEACAVAKEIPVAMMKPLKDELQDLQRREIITRLEWSTDWISGMVAVQKQNGKPRVCTDQKPLNKALKHHWRVPSAPKRLQRMMMHVQKYDLDVVYTPGKDMLLLDTLGRAYLPECSSYGSVQAEIETFNMVHHLPISGDRLNAICSATKDNKIGWPNDEKRTKKKHQQKSVHTSHSRRSLAVKMEWCLRVNGLSSLMRREITQHIHSSHLQMDECLWRAREQKQEFFWFGMNDQIRTHVAKCDNKEYLITMGYYSNIWGNRLSARHKVHDSDKESESSLYSPRYPWYCNFRNGPQYASQEFPSWLRDLVTWVPQSNSKESAFKTAKRLMLKAKAATQAPYLALLDHHNTPSQGLDTSPVQRFFNLCTRTLLPTKSSLPQP